MPRGIYDREKAAKRRSRMIGRNTTRRMVSEPLNVLTQPESITVADKLRELGRLYRSLPPDRGQEYLNDAVEFAKMTSQSFQTRELKEQLEASVRQHTMPVVLRILAELITVSDFGR